MLIESWVQADHAQWRVCSAPDEQGEGMTQAALKILRTHDLGQEISGPADPFPEPGWIKGSALKGKATARHGLRFRLGLGLPRLREAQNLRWLGKHLFVVPRPLVALAIFRTGFPRGQWLVTQAQTGAQPLLDVWAKLSPPEQEAALLELAREVARMHALGFTHRDLFLRNLMWREDPQRNLVFLDCWRGGPGFDLRGPSWDVGCLLVDLVQYMDGPRAQAWLQEYENQRALQGRPIASGKFLRRALKARRAITLRLIAQPERLGGAPPPPLDWLPTWEPGSEP